MTCRLLLLLALLPALQSGATLASDPPIDCGDCAAWNRPLEPFRIFGNTYFVGTAGLSAVLVTSDEGLILVDAGLPQSAPIIDAGIRKLGFRTEDIRLIVNSHAHFDHAGGIAALQRVSGARVAASPAGARDLEQGGPSPDDPQPTSHRYPPASWVQVVQDGETLRVGPLALTAHLTPGHTPGATTWTWRSCEGERCVDVVYADSLTAVSEDGFRFSGDARRPSIADQFRNSLTKVEQLPCDILLAPHPWAVSLEQKAARLVQDPSANPFIEAGACRAFAATARKRLEERLAKEAQ